MNSLDAHRNFLAMICLQIGQIPPTFHPNTFNQNSDNGRYPLTQREVFFYEIDELVLEKTIIFRILTLSEHNRHY